MPRTVDEILDAIASEVCEATPEKITSALTMLILGEERWRDHHGVLKEEGYEHWPGWKPSRLELGADPIDCEDGEVSPVGCYTGCISSF